MPSKSKLSRRQFLQIAPILMAAPFVRPSTGTGNRVWVNYQPASDSFAAPGDHSVSAPFNVIIILFDALSALNMNTYGYPRETINTLERFARRSIVYHNHHSAGNFTTPSTASFLTGVYPWTHRAFTLGGQVSAQHTPGNMFNMLAGAFNKVAYTQNLYADTLLRQFSASLDRLLPLNSFTLSGHTFYNRFTQKDSFFARKSYDDFLFDQEETSGSLFLSAFHRLMTTINLRRAEKKFGSEYPAGFPLMQETSLAFTIDQAFEGVIQSMKQWQAPFLTYLHFMPPHAPYRPHRDFLDLFNDEWQPLEKPIHPLSKGTPQQNLNRARLQYDRFVANLDAEASRLFDYLESSGRFDDSYVIFTSDHGEMFERGMQGHATRMMYEPILHVPLMISTPGRRERQDIYAQTSTVDVLPSLLHLAGLPIPDWCDGAVLPGIGGQEDGSRQIYSVEAKSNSVFGALKKTSIAMYQENFKLIRYLGYAGSKGNVEFYDLKNDPQEMEDLSTTHPMVKEMLSVLEEKLEVVNQPFE
jgi:arylsulfatase A-like enzyme